MQAGRNVLYPRRVKPRCHGCEAVVRGSPSEPPSILPNWIFPGIVSGLSSYGPKLGSEYNLSESTCKAAYHQSGPDGKGGKIVLCPQMQVAIQAGAPLFRDDDGGPPSAPSGTRCGGSGGGSSLGNSGRAVDQARGRQPLSGAEKRNV